ncbi:MAG: BatD family protein [Gammaproteobacteria bacterium]
MILRPFKNKILLCILIVFYSFSSLCFANTLEMQISSDQVTLGDSFFVTYILNNKLFSHSPDFSALQKDFQILNTNYGKEVNMVNGATSIQTFWRLQLVPKRAGDLIIPEINFGSEKSTAHKLVVITDQHNQQSQTIGSTKQNVFARGEVSTTSPYVQGEVLYTFKLYFRNELRDPRIEMPQIKDVTFFQLDDRPIYQATINGDVFNVVEKRFVIFPKKPGAITLPPIKFYAYTIEDNMNAFINPFDAPKTVSVATKEINLSVRDVPPSYPKTAWLPANNISLTEQWSNKEGQWESGTPVTRTITITAQGLRADQLPDILIDKINGVNVYVDRPKRRDTIQNDKIVSVMEQKVTYIPNTTESFTIPSIKINWWNTQIDSNAVTQLKEMNVKVKSVAVPSPSINTISTPAAKPANIPTAATPETKIIVNTFYTSIWFWMACVSFLAWIVTLGALLRKKAINKNTTLIQTHASIEISDKNFEQACHQGQTIQAQQYLLAWAKKLWPEATLNLATLCEIISDETFQLAVHELEQALYAKETYNWDGSTLLTAFKKIKKSRKHLNSSFNKRSQLSTDPLPPLNP